MNYNIAILLSTYNGSKYLTDLLDSLINQSLLNIKIYISDDGSTDTTLQIIHHYLEKNKNIILIDNKSNRGAFHNFMFLLNSVDADYYLFSDQDDIWLKEKSLTLVNRIVDLENYYIKTPIVVHSELTVVDENLNLISNSFNKFSNINQDLFKMNKLFYMVTNSIVGCSMCINKYVKNVCFPINPNALMHDSWISLSVISNHGVIDFLPINLTLYRQHNSNVIGAKKSTGLKYFVSKFSNIYSVIIENKARFLLVNTLNPSFKGHHYIYYKILYLILR